MDDSKARSPEMQRLLEARDGLVVDPAPAATDLDAFLLSLEERFHPDRVNIRLWHCRTQEEFDRERDALLDPEEELTSRPDLDGGKDHFFTDRN